jgi:hypothetical protein
MDMKRMNNRESGVSETVAFIIIFGIVMTGIGIVTLYGYPALMSQQENANIKNMEKNMLVLQSDLKSLTFKSVPYQETAIQVSGGTLTIREDPPSDPYFLISNDTGYPIVPQFEPGELKFISGTGEATIVLENGAVHIRYWSSPDGSAMISTPPWYYDEVTRTYVIYLIRVNGTEDMGQTGIGTVKMQLADQQPPIEYPIASGETITVTYHPNIMENYKIAWRNYFNSPELHMTEVPSPSDTVFTLGAADMLVIKRYNVTFLSL